ncbi:MAG TPA: methionyl-tRNA formyltransferase [Vicinamibacterales bacterium]
MRLVIFGDGVWAARSVEQLVQAGHRIPAVVLRARPTDDTLMHAAAAAGAGILQPDDVNAPAFVERLAAIGADVHLSIAYDQILRAPVRATARVCLNIHAGRLPDYRGRNVITWAIINNEREIGVTVHAVDDGVDTGPILLQRLLPIGWTDTYGDVLARVQETIPTLALEAAARLERESPTFRPQPAIGTYCPGRRDGDEWLDWSDSSLHLYNKIRALSPPAPGARTMWNDHEVTVWRARYDPSWPRYLAIPGAIVGREADGVRVKTGDSTIVLTEVQIAGRERQTPRWAVGTRLGLDLQQTIHALLDRIARLEARVSQGVPS